jgi:hypothetical protein
MSMFNHYLPIFCAACRTYVLVHKEANLTLPWRIEVKGSDARAYCSDACQGKGPPRPEGKRVTAFLDLERTKGLLVRKGAEDALMGFLTPISDHPEYLDGHKIGMSFREVAEKVIENWPARVKPEQGDTP